MNYKESLDYIHGVSNFFCKPGLERIRELCNGLGNPQKKLRFIHVAGTNGKGSTCAMLDSVLRAAGYRVGLYTSPYVKEFNERMRVNGKNIPDDALARITERVKAVAEKMEDSPTEFELITAIAFEYFLEEKCNIVILEVGMGGRYDATNIIDAPLLSVITGIAIDHTAFLGDTVEQIATEKAGIIKHNSVALFGGKDSTAEGVIANECAKMQTTLCKVDYSKLKINSTGLDGTYFDYRGRSDIKLSLLGGYQPKNAAVVLDAIDRLSGVGLRVSEDAIRRGLSSARWPARFEIIKTEPTVIFDGAHNSQGIRAAVNSIKQYFGEKRVIVLTGVLRDKDYREIAAVIAEVADCALTISPDNPRRLTAEEYASVLSENGVSAIPCSSIREALDIGVRTAAERNTALCCLGSLYTYGQVVSCLQGDD